MNDLESQGVPLLFILAAIIIIGGMAVIMVNQVY